MHKLGDTVTTEEEEEKFRRIKEKIRSILTARRNLYNAGMELLECDRVYAERPQCLPIVLSRRRSFSASPSRYSICPRFPQRIVT